MPVGMLTFLVFSIGCYEFLVPLLCLFVSSHLVGFGVGYLYMYVAFLERFRSLSFHKFMYLILVFGSSGPWEQKGQ